MSLSAPRPVLIEGRGRVVLETCAKISLTRTHLVHFLRPPSLKMLSRVKHYSVKSKRQEKRMKTGKKGEKKEGGGEGDIKGRHH